MGYESKIMIVDRWEVERNDGNTFAYARRIVDIDMCKMGYEFVDLFDKEIDYELYIDNEETRTDKYGDIMTYTDCKTVIDHLEKLIADGETYRRIPMLLGLLKGINEEQWHEIQVVHYGY